MRDREIYYLLLCRKIDELEERNASPEEFRIALLVELKMEREGHLKSCCDTFRECLFLQRAGFPASAATIPKN